MRQEGYARNRIFYGQGNGLWRSQSTGNNTTSASAHPPLTGGRISRGSTFFSASPMITQISSAKAFFISNSKNQQFRALRRTLSSFLIQLEIGLAYRP